MSHLLKIFAFGCLGLFLVAVVSFVWWLFWGPELMVFSSNLEPDRQYKLLTGLDRTDDVTDVEGIGGGWQGYDFWLRFRCSPKTVDRIIEQGFVECDSDELEDKLDFRSRRHSFEPDHFTPEWEPSSLDEQRCYKVENFKNEWTESAYVWFAYEPSTGWIHMYSVGPD